MYKAKIYNRYESGSIPHSHQPTSCQILKL